jgi:mono/diheme cytochrome c family protein
MNRLLIESIEGRILLGITMFVGVMILVGWVAINEPARMTAFERQHLGRSIERGAETFAANCSTCHGTDGRGIINRAPGLNSPHLFGYDFLADVNNEILSLERSMSTFNDRIGALNNEREDLFSEVATAEAERQTEILARLQEIDSLIDPSLEGSIAAEAAALEEELAPLYAEREAQLDALLPAIDAGYLPRLEERRAQAESSGNPLILTNYIAQGASRLTQAGWEGSLQAYIQTTLVHGRPGSENVWGEGNMMVAWSQLAGGPLRPDQIEDVTNYILNWDQGSNWDSEDLYAVNQFAKLYVDSSMVTVGGGDSVPAVFTDPGSDLEDITAAVVAVEGDPARGEALYNGDERADTGARLACYSCHMGGVQAPATEVTWSNVVNLRLNEDQFAGYSPEQYLVESITYPNEYVVEGYASGVMPGNYGEQLSVQDLADITAYLRTYAEE